MSIHDNSHFEAFLASVRVEREPTNLPYARLSTTKPLYLVYPELALKLESVLKVIRKELTAAGCCESRDIALATLALIAETRPDNSSSISHANETLKRIIPAKLHSAIVTARTPESSEYCVRIGPCEIKPFNPTKLLYWSERTNSKWPKDLNRFRGLLAIQREPFDLKVINWNDVELVETMLRKWSIEEITESLVDEYYQNIFSNFKVNLRAEISHRLLVMEAASMVGDHSEILEELMSTTFGLFVMDSKTGWALMGMRNQITFNTTPASVYSICREWLVRELGFLDFEAGRPIDETASKYCGFLRRAQRHKHVGNFDEAFLHFVVALDLLLGERSSLGESVAGRAATVTHKVLGLEWADQRKRVLQLYDARSRYVHEGAAPSERDLRDAEGVCLEILWSLLTTCSRNQIRHIDEWLKAIDYVLAATQANKPIANDELTRLGIAFDKVIRKPPNRVLDDLERNRV